MKRSRYSEEQIIGILKENRELKKLLTESALDVAMLKEMLAKNF